MLLSKKLNSILSELWDGAMTKCSTYLLLTGWCVAHRGCLAVVDCIYEPEVVDHSILQEVFRIMEPDAEKYVSDI